MTVKSAALTVAAALCAVTLASAAEARGPNVGAGPAGGHVGSMAPMGPMGHAAGHAGHGPGHMANHVGSSHMGHVVRGHDGHHHHHGFFPVYGFGIDDGYYDYDYYGDDDCYRVYRHHRWRIVCED